MKDLKYLQLLEIYAPLLTGVQREICEQYYLYDLSLSEIAEEKGISKQSVSDTLKKSREQIAFYEEKLALSQRQTELLSALEILKQNHPDWSEELAPIADMVGGNSLSRGK